MGTSEKVSSTLTLVLLLTQVVLSVFIIQRLNDMTQVAVAAGNNQLDVPMLVENVSVDDDPSLGPKDAPITIVEFADYECPFCAEAVPMVKQLLEDNPGSIRFVLRDFPLEHIHPNAFKAAEAANCAADQGKYWEMHDLLFSSQDELTEEKFIEHATELQLDTAQFTECLSSGKYIDEIRHDMHEGREYQVNGTPTFFINGQRLIGPTRDQLQQAVAKKLSEK